MLYIEPKSQMGLNYEEVHFQAKDGTHLFGWYFPARLKKKTDHPKGTIIQFHGNATNLSSHFVSLVWLAEEGYDFFTFDYRGYGRSEGKPDPEGTAQDGVAALLRAQEFQKKRASPLLIPIGQSLGGAILMRSLQDLGETIHPELVVLESTFVSYQTIGKRILARSWYSWPFQYLAYLLVSDQYSGMDWIQSYKGNLIILHDQSDPIVPFACGEDLNRFSPAKEKEFWTLNDGNHIAALGDPKGPYRKRLLDRLKSLKAAHE